MTDKKKRGRPVTVEGGETLSVYLDPMTKAKALALGKGNISRGVRVAINEAFGDKQEVGNVQNS